MHRLLYCFSALALATNFLFLSGPNDVRAGEPAEIQASVRPLGVMAYAPVMKSGSDARAADFNANQLPYFLELINQKLAERANFTGRDGFRLDASKLFLRTESDKTIRVYFVHEGAGYQNTLGFSMTPAGAETLGTPFLIFPNASFHGTKSTRRTESAPLVVGDFVDLNSGGPGIQLDFFLISDGARRPTNPVATWFNDQSKNADGKQHVVAFMLPNTRFVLIGFEDLWGGGDLDYNDCLFVVDIGEINAENLFDVEGTLPH